MRVLAVERKVIANQRAALRPERQVVVEQSGEEHGVELQALRAVIGQQVHAAARLLGREPPRELVDERGDVGVGVRLRELLGEGPQPREVRLPGDLLVGVGLDLRIETERRR